MVSRVILSKISHDDGFLSYGGSRICRIDCVANATYSCTALHNFP